MDKEDMRQQLAKLYEDSPELFTEIATDLIQYGGSALKSETDYEIEITPYRQREGRRRKRVAQVMQWTWAKIEFLKFRDGNNVRQACERLCINPGTFTIYDTPDNKWQSIKSVELYKDGRPAKCISESKPPTYSYTPAKADTLRRIYYDFYGLNDDEKGTGQMLLDYMIDGHHGGESPLDSEWINKHLP